MFKRIIPDSEFQTIVIFKNKPIKLQCWSYCLWMLNTTNNMASPPVLKVIY